MNARSGQLIGQQKSQATLTISQQAFVILEAFEHQLLRVDGIIRWADSVIVASEQPAWWLIELSTHNPNDIAGLVSLLRAQATESLPLRWRVQIIVLAQNAGRLSVRSSLPKLFQVLIFDNKGAKEESLDKSLIDALIEWDSQDDLDVIEPALHAKFERLFRDYLTDAQLVSKVLRLGHEAVA
jgi:hypothetical protein